MSESDLRTGLRFVLDLARDRLWSQVSASDSLDTKIAVQFAGGSVLIGLLAALFSISAERLRAAEITTLALAMVAYACLTALTAVASWPRHWQIGPSVDWAWNRSHEVGEHQLLSELISGYMEYWRKNEGNNKSKSLALRGAYLAVISETGCLVAALVIVTS